jgi:hypothetical protein
MTYAHMFWDLFGLSVKDWDHPRMTYGDFEWMKAQADEALRERAAAEAAAKQQQGG